MSEGIWLGSSPTKPNAANDGKHVRYG